ncbi:MAG: hypothetical protein WCL54_04895 [Clostridia bacterium]
MKFLRLVLPVLVLVSFLFSGCSSGIITLKPTPVWPKVVEVFHKYDLAGTWFEKGFVDRFFKLKSFAKALDGNVNIIQLQFRIQKTHGGRVALVPYSLEEGNVETYIKETSETNTFLTKRFEGEFKMVLGADSSGRDLLTLSINGKPEAQYVKIIMKGETSVESFVNQNLLVGIYKDEKGKTYGFYDRFLADWSGKTLTYVTGQTFDYYDFDTIHVTNNKNKNLYYGFEWKEDKLVLFNTKFNGDMQQLGRLASFATLTRAIDESDFTISPFALNMKYEDFKNVIKDNPIISSRTENADALEVGATITTYTLQDGTLISFWKYKKQHTIGAIEITSERYQTPRGLKVGDSLSTLKKLYGKPSYVHNGEYSFNDGYMYDLFNVTVKDDKVIKIRVNLVC